MDASWWPEGGVTSGEDYVMLIQRPLQNLPTSCSTPGCRIDLERWIGRIYVRHALPLTAPDLAIYTSPGLLITMSSPVVALLFVYPEHWRRGPASMLLRWGTQKADELGLKTFVESTDDGKPCYERNGFTYMSTVYIDAARRGPSDGQGLGQESQGKIPLMNSWFQTNMMLYPWKPYHFNERLRPRPRLNTPLDAVQKKLPGATVRRWWIPLRQWLWI